MSPRWVRPSTNKQQANQPQEAPQKPPTGYERDALWAWAAVRFGWTPDEFDRLTAAQIALLQVAEHDRVASDQMLLNEAIATALANGYKKKSEEPELLWVEANKPDKKTMSAQEARDKMAALEKALSNQQK